MTLTVSFLLAACSPAPNPDQSFPAASTSATSVRTLVVAPVPAEATIKSSPTTSATQVTPEARERRITAAVNASLAGRDGRINLVLHSPANHVYVDVGSQQQVRGASIIKLLFCRRASQKSP